MRFQYDKDIFARYPSIVGGVILANALTNGPSSARLQAIYREEQQKTLTRLGNTPLSKIESLSAWRAAFRGFGVDPTQYRSAAEALLRRLTKKGDIPGINTLVDIGNLVSIRYALPVAVFDTQDLEGAITVHFADGTERFTTLKESEVEHPESGEVIFSDESKLVIARRWCWRQSEPSAAHDETTHAIITVEAHHERRRHDIAAALDDLLALLKEYAGMGEDYISGVLDVDNPTLKADW